MQEGLGAKEEGMTKMMRRFLTGRLERRAAMFGELELTAGGKGTSPAAGGKFSPSQISRDMYDQQLEVRVRAGTKNMMGCGCWERGPTRVCRPRASSDPRFTRSQKRRESGEKSWKGPREGVWQKSTGDRSRRSCSTEPGISARSRVRAKQMLWSCLLGSVSGAAVCREPNCTG